MNSNLTAALYITDNTIRSMNDAYAALAGMNLIFMAYGTTADYDDQSRQIIDILRRLVADRKILNEAIKAAGGDESETPWTPIDEYDENEAFLASLDN